MSENPYQAPENPESIGLATEKRAIVLPLLANLFLLATLAVVLFYRARFLKLFAEFEVELPIVTRLVLHPVTILIHGGLLALAVGLALGVKSSRIVNVGSSILLIGCGFLFLVEILAVLLPIFFLAESLS
jgi:type II secretory pathway component PulF